MWRPVVRVDWLFGIETSECQYRIVSALLERWIGTDGDGRYWRCYQFLEKVWKQDN